MNEEGSVKFKCNFIEAPATLRSGNLQIRFAGAEIRRSGKKLRLPRPYVRGIPRRRIKTKPNFNIRQLNKWRTKLHKLGLIGVNDKGIGFGNISQRIKGQKFIITGTSTGGIPILDKNHYTVVHKADIKRNTVNCRGPIIASSESMSHAAIYKTLPNINAVIHVHYQAMWKKLLDKIPTTSQNACYGTPEIANEIKRLLKETDLKKKKYFVTAGHTDGIFSFGRDVQEAGEILLRAMKSSLYCEV